MSAALRGFEPHPQAAVPLGLLREIGDLKRIRSAGRRGSVATRLFREAWSALAAGDDAASLAWSVTARALAAARLGDLDREALRALGLSADEAAEILGRGLREAGTALPAGTLDRLAAALSGDRRREGPELPAFVAALEQQPRAGITCPGRPRIMLQPAESHAEHCLAVAVYGVLLAGPYGADPAAVFLAGLAHHLHNAAMPDSGFTGEMLLGTHLLPAMQRATEQALAQLDQPLRREVERACRILPDAGTPDGRAFHAADVLDRVLEIEQHLVPARLTMAEVLGPMALVHDGPVKPFHDAVLAAHGLLP